MTTPAALERARLAAQEWLLPRDEPDAVIAAHENGVAESDEAARLWVSRILHEQREDGSWGGLLATAGALLTLRELREAAALREQDPGIGRALDWIRSRRGPAGAWTEGCDPDRHRAGWCHHFAAGFLATTPAEEEEGEGEEGRGAAHLRAGAAVAGVPELRFTASAVALRALLAWGRGGVDARLHLEGLRRVVLRWGARRPEGLGYTALLSAIHALLLSPVEEDRRAAGHGLRLLGGAQRGDGSWADADAFQALDVLGAALDADMEADRTRIALGHGARLLVSTQQENGSWGPEWGGRRALTALRTFRRI